MSTSREGDRTADRENAGTQGRSRTQSWNADRPVVDEKQLDQDLRYLEIARNEGGTPIGGERLERETPGYYLAPALVTGTDQMLLFIDPVPQDDHLLLRHILHGPGDTTRSVTGLTPSSERHPVGAKCSVIVDQDG